MARTYRTRQVEGMSPRERIERAFHVSFILPERAASLLDSYRNEVRRELLNEVLATVRETPNPQPYAGRHWHWFAFARNRIAQRLIERFDIKANRGLQ